MKGSKIPKTLFCKACRRQQDRSLSRPTHISRWALDRYHSLCVFGAFYFISKDWNENQGQFKDSWQPQREHGQKHGCPITKKFQGKWSWTRKSLLSLNGHKVVVNKRHYSSSSTLKACVEIEGKLEGGNHRLGRARPTGILQSMAHRGLPRVRLLKVFFHKTIENDSHLVHWLSALIIRRNTPYYGYYYIVV